MQLIVVINVKMIISHVVTNIVLKKEQYANIFYSIIIIIIGKMKQIYQFVLLIHSSNLHHHRHRHYYY